MGGKPRRAPGPIQWRALGIVEYCPDEGIIYVIRGWKDVEITPEEAIAIGEYGRRCAAWRDGGKVE